MGVLHWPDPPGLQGNYTASESKDTLAERSKASAQGAIPKGRGFEPHRCHFPDCAGMLTRVLPGYDSTCTDMCTLAVDAQGSEGRGKIPRGQRAPGSPNSSARKQCGGSVLQNILFLSIFPAIIQFGRIVCPNHGHRDRVAKVMD